MKTKKQIVSLLLAMCMVLALVPGTGLANPETSSTTVDISQDQPVNEGNNNIKGMIETALVTNAVVTVTGSKNGNIDSLKLDIPANKKVVWSATYAGYNLSALSGLIVIENLGTFEVANGGRIVASTMPALSSNGGEIIIGGTGVVSSTSNNHCAITSTGNITVQDRAVVSAQYTTIYAYGSNSTVAINGGTIFGTSTGIDDNTIIRMNPAKTPEISGNAAVITWNQNQYTVAGQNYLMGSSTDITTNPGTAATWTTDGTISGITYSNGSNSSFIELPVVVLEGVTGTVVNNATALASKMQETTPQTIVLGRSFSMTTIITLGASHTLVIPAAKTLTTNGQYINLGSHTLKVNGGGVLECTGTGMGAIEGLNAALILESITVNLKVENHPSLNVNNITLDNGATLNIDAPSSGDRISVIQSTNKSFALTVNTGAILNINQYQTNGIHNMGMLHINGGTVNVSPGSATDTGINNYGLLKVSHNGQLLGTSGALIDLIYDSKVDGVGNIFKDRGTVFTATGETTAASGNSAPTPNSLNNGRYIWDGTHFSRTLTVNWTDLSAANGASETENTTQLSLGFSYIPTTLTTEHITVHGATKGELSGTGRTKTLTISDITVANGEEVTVAIANPDGYNITPLSKTVAVYKAAGAIINAQPPAITTHPATPPPYTQNAVVMPLSVAATSTDGGILSYQWYKNTINNNTSGTPIANVTTAAYAPPTYTEGTVYYYCVVTNTNTNVNGSQTATTTSNTAAITVTAPSLTAFQQLKAKLESDSPQTITVNEDITVAEAITLGTDHTLVISPGKTITATVGNAFNLGSHALSVSGGTLILNAPAYSIVGSSGTLNLSNIAVNITKLGIRVGTLNLNSGTTVTLDAAEEQHLISVADTHTLTVNTGAKIDIKDFYYNAIALIGGTLHINGGEVKVGPGSKDSAGIAATYYGNNLATIKFSSGTLEGIDGGNILLYKSVTAQGLNGKFSDQNHVLNQNGIITIGDRDTAPSANGLTSGYYYWDGNQFAKHKITITAPPQNKTVTAGEISGTLSVAATASNGEALSYQWWKSTQQNQLGMSTKLNGATTSTLTLPTDLSTGTHYFFCEINAPGCSEAATISAIVTVTAAGGQNPGDGNDSGNGGYTPPITVPTAPAPSPKPTSVPATPVGSNPAGSGASAATLTSGSTLAVTSGSLTLRDESGNAIGTLKTGDRLIKIGQQGAWTLVQLPDGSTGRVVGTHLADAGAAATGTITSNSLTVRNAAGGAAIGRLEKDDVFTILDIVEGWAKIQLQDGTIGYAAKQYIQAQAAQAPEGIIKSQSLTLRDAKGNAVGKLSPDDAFKVLFIKGNWATIMLNGSIYQVAKAYITNR